MRIPFKSIFIFALTFFASCSGTALPEVTATFTHPFAAVIPLGKTCTVAWQLRRKNLIGPCTGLEWVITPLSGLVKLIRNDFKNFLQSAEMLEKGGVLPYPVDAFYKIGLTHDHFSIRSPHSKEHQEIIEKYERRFERFKEILEKARKDKQPILFIRFGSSDSVSSESPDEVIVLAHTLHECYPGLDFTLLVIDDWFDKPWMFPNIVNYRIKQYGWDGWKGTDAGWDTILDQIKLISPIETEAKA